MAETISMPKLGFDMAEGTLIRWVKKVGEIISKGDVLAEIENRQGNRGSRVFCQRCGACAPGG